MRSIERNHTLYRDRTYKFQFRVKRTSDGENYDITGCNLTFSAKYSYDSADVLFSCDLLAGTGIVANSYTGGLATITISSAKTSSLPNEPVTLVYEMTLTDVNSAVWEIMRGELTILPTVA